MILFLVPTPENKLERKGRETGWHRVPLDRDSKKEFRERLKVLADKGVEYVLGSDLDTEATVVAANELHLPYRTEFALRRFNLGRHHAAPADNIHIILGAASNQWKVNPDVPVRGGDSLSSYRKRFWGFIDKMLVQDGDPVCMLLGLREIRSIRKREPEYWITEQVEINRAKVYIAEIAKKDLPKMPDNQIPGELLRLSKRQKDRSSTFAV